jgi:amino acid transporter
LSLRIFISYKIYKKKGKEYAKNLLKFNLKIIIIAIICVIIIVSIYNFLPKYETDIYINIINNNVMTEIIINGDFYNINENIKNIHINENRGFIAIKTENKNKIVFYNNDESIFSFVKKIKIIIDNEVI